MPISRRSLPPKANTTSRSTFLQFKLRTHQLTVEEEAKAEIAALNEEYTAQAATLQKELTLANLSLQQKQVISNKIVQLQQQQALKIQQINEKAQEQELSEAGSIANGMLSAWNANLSGLLQGTETWAQALGSTFEGILESFIEMVEKMIAEWLVLEAISFLTTGGPAPASALNAVVQSVTGLPKLAVGAWEIPGTMAAVLHSGEMVVPAAPAAALRNALTGAQPATGKAAGGGDTHVHFHLDTIDARTGAEFLKKNVQSIATSLNKHLQLNPSRRPRW